MNMEHMRHVEPPTVQEVQGPRVLKVRFDMGLPDKAVMQTSLALHLWLKLHPKEKGFIDFNNPRSSDKALQGNAMALWMGKHPDSTSPLSPIQPPDSFAAHFSAYMDTLKIEHEQAQERGNEDDVHEMMFNLDDTQDRESFLVGLAAPDYSHDPRGLLH